MMGWSTMNEKLPDRTPNGMPLDVSVSPKKTLKRIQETTNV